MKPANITDEYSDCRLCPRSCGVDRRFQTGYCGSGSLPSLARAGLHYYEEPFLSGCRGSGTVFFTGCSLRCVYCQNAQISYDGGSGTAVSEERLAQIFLQQQERGAHNLNLVTGTHFAPSIAAALRIGKRNGLRIPVIWNSSGYEKPETLMMLEGLVDIFLPDFKTMSGQLGQKYMNAPDYPERAKKALEYMVSVTGEAVFEEEESEGAPNASRGGEYAREQAMLKKGVVVRHLVIPGHVKDTEEVLRYLHETYGNRIWISLMNQYTPVGTPRFPELKRTVSRREYERAVDFAISLGIENCMIQEGKAASESFIPDFDGSGVVRETEFT